MRKSIFVLAVIVGCYSVETGKPTVRNVDWCVHRCHYEVRQGNVVIASVVEDGKDVCNSYTDQESFMYLTKDEPYLTYVEGFETQKAAESFKRKALILCGKDARHER